MSFRTRASDHKRREEEETKKSVICPSCKGFGESLQEDLEYRLCNLCGGVGKVVPVTDKRGGAGFRPAFFITGPPLHGNRDPKALEERKRRPRSNLPPVDEQGRARFAIAYVPFATGSIEEQRFGEAADLILKLGEDKEVNAQIESRTKSKIDSKKQKATRHQKKKNEDDEVLPCPS